MDAFSSIARSATLQPRATLEHPVHLAPQSEVHNASSVGRYSFLNVRSVVYPNVAIGRYCSIGRNCELGVAAHPTSYLSSHSFQYHGALFPNWDAYQGLERKSRFLAHSNTTIGNDVWIGAQSIVIAGVTIGDGAIVAANSVVTRDVDPYSIVGGSPARLIRLRFDPEIIAELLGLGWWDLPVEMLSGVPFDDVRAAIAWIRGLRQA
ncbi:CatB-related O-acetyltransferase [Cupriavidus necator]